jgi:hypothetical protein
MIVARCHTRIWRVIANHYDEKIPPELQVIVRNVTGPCGPVFEYELFPLPDNPLMDYEIDNAAKAFITHLVNTQRFVLAHSPDGGTYLYSRPSE